MKGTYFQANIITSVFISHKALFHKVQSADPSPFTAGVTFSHYLSLPSHESAQTLLLIIKLLGRHIDPSTHVDWNKLFAEYDGLCGFILIVILHHLVLSFGPIWNGHKIISNACLFERRKLTLTASVLNCNMISPCTFYMEVSKIHTDGGTRLRYLFCLHLLVFSLGIDFVLSYTWYYEWEGYLFTSPNQAWLGRAISAVMKSIFQARSTMVRSPAPRPLIKETFPPFWGVC